MTTPPIVRAIQATLLSTVVWAGLPAQAAPVEPAEAVAQAALTAADYLEVTGKIKQLHRYRNKDLNRNTAGPLIRDIVQGLLHGSFF